MTVYSASLSLSQNVMKNKWLPRSTQSLSLSLPERDREVFKPCLCIFYTHTHTPYIPPLFIQGLLLSLPFHASPSLHPRPAAVSPLPCFSISSSKRSFQAFAYVFFNFTVCASPSVCCVFFSMLATVYIYTHIYATHCDIYQLHTNIFTYMKIEKVDDLRKHLS